MPVRGAPDRHANVLVAEREGSPVLEDLVLKNLSATAAMLLAGELFEAGCQQGLLNDDLQLMPGQQLVTSVCCVEHGRWNGDGAHQRHARQASMLLRAAQTTSTGSNRQHQVWDRVSLYDRESALSFATVEPHPDKHVVQPQ